MPKNPAPGFQKKPDHKVALTPFIGNVQVILGDIIIAESAQAIKVTETNHGDCFYVPRTDVAMDQATMTETSSYCPFKGLASYYSFGAATDAAWSYEAPYDECVGLKDYLAFYPNRVSDIWAG